MSTAVILETWFGEPSLQAQLQALLLSGQVDEARKLWKAKRPVTKHYPGGHDHNQQLHASGRTKGIPKDFVVDMSGIESPVVRQHLENTIKEALAEYPCLYDSVPRGFITPKEDIGYGNMGETGKGAIFFEKAFVNDAGFMAKFGRNPDGTLAMQEGFLRDPYKALVWHEVGHALENHMGHRYSSEPFIDPTTGRRNPKYEAMDRVQKQFWETPWSKPGFTGGSYQRTNTAEGFAEAFAAMKTLPKDQWPEGAHRAKALLDHAKVAGSLDRLSPQQLSGDIRRFTRREADERRLASATGKLTSGANDILAEQGR